MITISNPSDIATLQEVVVGPSKRFTKWDLVPRSLRDVDLAGLRYLRHNTVRIPRHDIASQEHAEFVRVIAAAGVVIHQLESLQDVAIQLYPRDLAFAVDDTLFLARSRDPIRRREQHALMPLLDKVSKVAHIDAGFIEGGDVIVTDTDVLVGLSEATNLAGITAFRLALHEAGIKREVVPIEFSSRGVVHLDTKFTMLGPQLGYVHSASLTPYARAQLADRFELIEATDDECRALMVNTVALNPTTILADARATRLSEILASHGIDTVPIDFSEVTKFPGGLRCATLPLRRESS